ncbi:MAG: DUF2141 domain-containing protein [Aureispira sp.]|nr:DUF2141 domain-containing protein [Aureispira sp.]
MKSIVVFIFSLSLWAVFSAFMKPNLEANSTLEVVVTDIRNSKGNLVMGFYKDSKSFSKRAPFMSKVVGKRTMRNGVVKFKISLPAGTYGIALLDDENENGKADYGFLLPIEGFGFSDFYHRGILAPTFTDFDFKLGSTDKSVVVKLKYM